jgi:hypothetical protein
MAIVKPDPLVTADSLVTRSAYSLPGLTGTGGVNLALICPELSGQLIYD